MKRAIFFLVLVACVVGIFLFRHRETSEGFPGVTLRYSFWGSDTEIAAMDNICRRFEASHPGIRIKTEPLPWGQYWQKIKTQAAGTQGNPPDIIRMTSLQSAEWYSYHLLLDLTPYIERDRVALEGFYPSAVSAVTWDNAVVSMPTDSAVRILMYNKDLFDRAGVPYLDPKKPLTWDELRDVARKLTVTKGDKVEQYGLSLGYMEFQAFVSQAGGRCVDRLVHPTRMTIDSPEGIRALAFYSGLILKDKDHVSPVTMQQQNLGFGAPDFALRSGKVAIQFGGAWSIPALSQEKWLRFGLAPIARDRERAQVAFTNSCGVYAHSAHPEEAWQFVKFCASPEGQEIIARRNVGIPVLRSVARSDAFLNNTPGVENMDVFLDELECAQTNVLVPAGEFRDLMDKIVTEQLCLGKITPEEAARRMETDGNRLIAAVPLKPTALTGAVLPAILIAALVAVVLALIVRARRMPRELMGAPARGETLAGYLFISPWLIGFVCFALGPMIVAISVGFTDWNIFQPSRYVGVENYRRALTSTSEFWQPLKVTLIFACASIPIQMCGGLLCAMLLNSPRLRFSGLFRSVIYLPYLLTGVAISIVWRWMYAENGLVNHFIDLINTVLKHLHFVALRVPAPNWLASETWALPAIILMEFTWLGGNMIIFLAALQGVPRSLYDAASVDGAGAVRKFLHVTLPMISPAILFNLIMGTIASFQVFAVPYIMTSGGPNDSTLFYALNLYRRAFGYNEMGYACALAVMLFVIIFAVTWLELRSSRRWVYYEGVR